MTLHLVDGNGYLHRAYHVSVGRGPMAGVEVFVQMIERIRRDRGPTHAAVVFDSGGRTWRHELHAGYKANREAPAPSLVAQLERAPLAAEAAGWPTIKVDGFEADDVIATIATKTGAAGVDVLVHASDKDLLALVGDRVRQVDHRGGEIGPAQVEAKLGVPPALITDYLALVGDTADNIPGVPGIGSKTACDLLQQHGSVEATIAANPKIRGKQPFGTPEGIAAARLSRQLVELRRDVVVGMRWSALELRARNDQALAAILAETPAVNVNRALTFDEQEDFEERAAIMEYEGELPRADAERLARAIVTKETPRWGR